jgi:hypothetical protein
MTAPAAPATVRHTIPALLFAATVLSSGLGLALTGGCVVEERDRAGFGQRVTGNSGRTLPGRSAAEADSVLLTASDAFAPLPAIADGRGSAAWISPESTGVTTGDVLVVEVTAVVEVMLRDASNDSAATPRFNLADMRAQGSGTFTGRTVGQLRGRLTVQQADEDGNLIRGMFLVAEAALVRDGELLARVPGGRTVQLIRRAAITPDGEERGGAPELVVRMDSTELGAEAERLFVMCLLRPLEPTTWAQRIGPARPRRIGETWPLEPGSVAPWLGLAPEEAIDPQGVARRIPTPGRMERDRPGDRVATIEIRTRAESVADNRIIEAFGPSLAGLPDAASVHRITGTVVPEDADTNRGATRVRNWDSVIAHRFRLLDRRGPIEGERLERIEVSITPAGR